MKSAKKQWRDFELLVTRIEAQAAPKGRGRHVTR
jgi:hypothetical protein